MTMKPGYEPPSMALTPPVEPEPEPESESLDINVQVVPAHETEVEMSSETHRVRIKSCEPLDQIVEHVDRLWARAQEDTARTSRIGFASQILERNPQAVRPPGSAAWPVQDL